MKNVLLVFILFITLSCGKDDEKSIPNVSDLSMKINGVLWEGKVLGNMVDSNTKNAVLSSLHTIAGETFGFTIEDFKGTGNYPTSNGANFTGALYGRKDKKVFSGGSEMKYNVNEVVGTKFHGTFSGKMKSSDGEVLTITEGKF